jgi:hypothetical protein
MVKQQNSSRSYSWMIYSLVVLIASGFIFYTPTFSSAIYKKETLSRYDILDLFAKDAMAWNISTTPIPISAPSVILKSILKKDLKSIPEELKHLVDQDTVRVQDVRNYLNGLRLTKLMSLCSGSNEEQCRNIVNIPDPEFGITPLHLALSYGDKQTAAYLKSLGADSDLLDSVGRKPQNMSFSSFIANSKKAAKMNCDLPVVTVKTADDFSEIRRLIREGEPVLMKGVMHLLDIPQMDLNKLVSEFGDNRVTVGQVPYADVFKLNHTISTLQDYYNKHVLVKSESPLYIFQKNSNLTRLGLAALSKLVIRAFPDIICPVEYGQTGSDSIHFYLGAKNSGAPFHIHADAINLVVGGQKRW